MIPIKVCGITSFNNAQIVINCNPSAIGFIFYKNSVRYVDPNCIVSWIDKIPANIKKVGVFVNENINIIESIVSLLDLDYIQLHGDESPQYCSNLSRPVIKAIRVNKILDNSFLYEYNVYAILLDTYEVGIVGGTGKIFNWELALGLNIKMPIILSGGLNVENIIAGIDIVKPAAVDINSGVESSPGKKDFMKVKAIFKKLENVINTSSIFDN